MKNWIIINIYKERRERNRTERTNQDLLTHKKQIYVLIRSCFFSFRSKGRDIECVFNVVLHTHTYTQSSFRLKFRHLALDRHLQLERRRQGLFHRNLRLIPWLLVPLRFRGRLPGVLLGM